MRKPYAQRVPFMGHALQAFIGPLAGYRKRAETHLRFIYPDMSSDALRSTATAVCNNFGRTLIENYSWQEFSQRLATTQPQGDGLAALAQAKSDGRPVIFVTGHFGNHEAPRQVLTAQGYTIGGLYRPMSNPFFNSHYAKTMTAWGGPVFAQGQRGTMGFARHLKQGGMGTLLFDVATARGELVDFMGKPAKTSTAAADLALRFDALVIPYFGIRQPDGLGFEVHVEAPITPASPHAMMQEMSHRLSARVNANPSQWFWVHRRWKSY